MTGINMVCWHAAVHRPQFILVMPVYPRGAVPPTVSLAKILCFVDCASLYNLVNKTNLVHNLFLVYLSISVCFGRNNGVFATLDTCYSVWMTVWYAGWNA